MEKGSDKNELSVTESGSEGERGPTMGLGGDEREHRDRVGGQRGETERGRRESERERHRPVRQKDHNRSRTRRGRGSERVEGGTPRIGPGFWKQQLVRPSTRLRHGFESRLRRWRQASTRLTIPFRLEGRSRTAETAEQRNSRNSLVRLP